MTLRDLIPELQALRVHPFTETNVEGVESRADGVYLNADLSAVEEELKESRENEARLSAELELVEAECTGLQARLDAVTVDPEAESAEELKRQCETIRETASAWARECEQLRRELTALRKRKGHEAGYFANRRAVCDLLDQLSTSNTAFAERAREIMTAVRSA